MKSANNRDIRGEGRSISRCCLNVCDTVGIRAEMEEGYDLQQAFKPLSDEDKKAILRTGSIIKEDDDGEGSIPDNIHQRLAALFDQARDRLEAVGRDSFFG